MKASAGKIRTVRLTTRLPIDPETPVGRIALRPHRDRWHILDDSGTPLCKRVANWEIADTSSYEDLALERYRVVCNRCHGINSYTDMPHDWEERDCGYTTPCWVWLRGTDRKGYSFHCIPGGKRVALAHRTAYQTAYGAIPAGGEIHHACRNKRCVNPEHLELHRLSEHRALHRQLDWNEIADLYDRGWKIKDIAVTVGGSKGGIKYALMMLRAMGRVQARKVRTR